MKYCRFKRSGKRDQVFLATKFGFDLEAPITSGPVINGTPEYATRALEKSLKRLGVDYVDLWYLHR